MGMATRSQGRMQGQGHAQESRRPTLFPRDPERARCWPEDTEHVRDLGRLWPLGAGHEAPLQAWEQDHHGDSLSFPWLQGGERITPPEGGQDGVTLAQRAAEQAWCMDEGG